jgi:hypothetical protein
LYDAWRHRTEACRGEAGGVFRAAVQVVPVRGRRMVDWWIGRLVE